MAAELPVVHLKIRHRATGLASPAVATQDLLAQTFVRQGVQPRRNGSWANHFHDAFSRRFSRKACCCSPGKNLKNRVIDHSIVSGFWSSRVAPARKSAQIISRQ